MKKTLLIIAALSSSLILTEANAAPTFQAAGAAVTGTGAVSPAWPAHQVNDIALLFVESTGGEAATLSTPASFVAVTNSPQFTGTGTNGTRLTVFWARATTTTMPSPTVADPGDHVYARILTYRGVVTTGNPWDVTGGGVVATASTVLAVTSITTTVADTLIVQAVARHRDRADAEFSAQTNVNLTGIAERADGGTTSGNGGGLAVWDGVKSLAGATGTTTATVSRTNIMAFLSIALKPALVLHHIRIEHDGTASTCAPEPITIKACANALCSTFYTLTNVTGVGLSPTGGAYTWTPGTTVAISAVAGGINSNITLARSSSGTASLAITGTSTPAPVNPFMCANTTTAVSGVGGSAACNLVFSSGIFSFNVPDHTAIARQVVTLTSCTANFASTTRAVKFWSSYINPTTGTMQARIAAGTGNADCVTGYSSMGTSSVSATTLNLPFGAGAAPQATFSLCYPDVGQVQVDTRYDGSAANTPPDAGTVILGNDRFIAAPHHFVVSDVSCVSGCFVTPNPAATNAFGVAFMKAGNPFSMTVTAYNSASAVTPNFGKETTPEGVTLTPAMIADPDLISLGAVSGVFGTFSAGAASGVAFSFNEVGIMTLTGKLTSANYLASGLKEITLPSSSNIGRFTPNHFTLTTDTVSPIVTRANFLPQIIAAVSDVGATAGMTIIPLDDATGFAVGDGVRIPGAGASAVAFTATINTVSAVPPTLTLNTPIGTDLAGGENVINEWGSYIGEKFHAVFTLFAKDLAGNTTHNYQGTYAKLIPTDSGNPLVFGAVDTAAPAYNLTLDTSVAAISSVFASGVAAVTAPLAVVRPAASAVGPYTSVKVGIAPMDSDGIMMNAYDLGVASSAVDHTSVMDPDVQATTTLRYGQMKLSNAHGSEVQQLTINATIQYWDGTSYVTSTQDSISTFATSDVLFGSVYKSIALDEVSVVSPPASVVFTNGAGSFRMAKPSGGDGVYEGGVEIYTIAPSYLPSNRARVTYGVYKGASEFIYMRENY